MRRVPSILLMTALLLAWPLAASAGVQAPGAAASTAAAGLRADFNGDGAADLAIGAPGEGLAGQTAAGVVHVLYGSAGGLTATSSQLWSQDSPGIADQAEDGDRLGSALATGDFNGDGPADLAMGAPGENLNSGFGSGVVHVLAGSGAGLTATGSQLWSQDSPGVAGAPEFLDFFGQTLAASEQGGTAARDDALLNRCAPRLLPVHFARGWHGRGQSRPRDGWMKLTSGLWPRSCRPSRRLGRC